MSNPAKLNHTILAAIVTIAKSSAASGVRWLVGGSVGSVLHGVEIGTKPNDLDIDTTGEGSLSLEALLSRYVQEPLAFSETSLYRNHFGRLNICGVKVDLIGDLDVKHPAFVHRFRITPDVWCKRAIILIDGFQVGLTPLEHQLILNLIRGREDRIQPIASYLRRHGPDWEFLEQTFAADNAPADFRQSVLDLLV